MFQLSCAVSSSYAEVANVAYATMMVMVLLLALLFSSSAQPRYLEPSGTKIGIQTLRAMASSPKSFSVMTRHRCLSPTKLLSPAVPTTDSP